MTDVKILSPHSVAILLLGSAFVAGCRREQPKLDLNKDTSDVAEKMTEGRPITPQDVMPKDSR